MNKPKIQLVLTADEQSVLLGLIDLALKHSQGGLNVAINAVVLAQKIQTAPAHDDTPKSEIRVPSTGLDPVAG